MAEFAAAADPADGLVDIEDSGAEPAEHVAYVRIDDYFPTAGALIVGTSGPGDLAALLGAEKTLAAAHVLLLQFNFSYYGEHAAKLGKLVALLEKAFVHCYAPPIEAKGSGEGFSPLFVVIMEKRASGLVILAKDPLH